MTNRSLRIVHHSHSYRAERESELPLPLPWLGSVLCWLGFALHMHTAQPSSHVRVRVRVCVMYENVYTAKRILSSWRNLKWKLCGRTLRTYCTHTHMHTFERRLIKCWTIGRVYIFRIAEMNLLKCSWICSWMLWKGRTFFRSFFPFPCPSARFWILLCAYAHFSS